MKKKDGIPNRRTRKVWGGKYTAELAGGPKDMKTLEKLHDREKCMIFTALGAGGMRIPFRAVAVASKPIVELGNGMFRLACWLPDCRDGSKNDKCRIDWNPEAETGTVSSSLRRLPEFVGPIAAITRR